MKINEIAFVCYAVDDLPRARAFYEGVLGLTPGSVWESEGMGFIEYIIGKNGEYALAIGKGAPQFKSGKTGATAALEVEDFDGALAEIKKAGHKLLMEPHDGKTCNMALIEDTEGNQIMIHRRKAK